MLDNDISTSDALRHLSTPEHALGASDDAHALDRRRFLQLVGMGMGAGMVAGPGSSLLDSALGNDNVSWAAGPIGPNDGILVVLGMYGGNDGLNTVVPISDGLYYDQHGALAIPAAETLSVNGNTGLNPALTELKRFWDQGNLAIVEGIGYPNPDLSHFSSMAKWMSGRPSGVPTSGWIGRWLDEYLGGTKDLFAAAEIGYSLPLHLMGEVSRATSVPATRPSFGANPEERHQRQYQAVRRMSAASTGFWNRQIGQAFVDQLDVARRVAPAIPAELPGSELEARLEVAARLINANLGFRVLAAGWGDFDSHAGQPQQHPARMEELNAAVRRFYSVLDPAWSSRVTFMTFSEFGRTSHANDGAGTDHGTAAPHFVFGANVRGGMYGQRPRLSGLERWERMAHHVDFRDYFGSVLDGWLGGGGAEALGRPIQNLGLFESPPGGPVPPSFTPPGDPVPTALTGYSALVPHRILDTRTGTGVARRKLGPDQSVVVQTAGTPGLPASGVRSVMVNITATGATGPTYFTIYPRGGIDPGKVSSLNPSNRRDCSNYVVTAVNEAGEFVLRNKSGQTDCVIDIIGYGSASGGSLLTPLAPERLLDTRTGNGVPRGPLRGGRTIQLQVAGRGGVPDTGATAVVLNITTTGASQPGFVMAHSTDVSRPSASNANYSPGHIISNLITCAVGADGKAAIFTSHGAVDMVADVVGYYGAAGSRLQAATPARILDTRFGIGASQRRLGAKQTIDLTVRGRGGVPSSATAVVMNLTAVAPTAAGYVTAFPGGTTMKNTSSINMVQGETLANLVISKIGDDGRVRLYNAAGQVDLVGDVTGWYV